MIDAAELFGFVDGIVGFRAHDGAHFDRALFFAIGTHFDFGRIAFAADPVILFIDNVVLVPFFLKVHGSG